MEVKQPHKYRVKLAFDLYSVGAIITPTGLWADSLLQRGYIERVRPESAVKENPVQVIKETFTPPKKRRQHAEHGTL